MILGSKGATNALPSRLSPVYIFIASQFQFTDSPGVNAKREDVTGGRTLETEMPRAHGFNLGGSFTHFQSPQACIAWYPSQPGQLEGPVMSRCLLIKMQRKGAGSRHSNEGAPTKIPT